MIVIKPVLLILEVLQVPFLFLLVIISRVLPKKNRCRDWSGPSDK